MTNRIHALTVVLEENVREDDAQEIINAIGMIRRVLEVKAHVTDVAQYTSDVRARHELGMKLADVIWPKKS